MVPERPTAQTSAAELPQIPSSQVCVPLATGDHEDPFHRMTVPSPPTAQTSAAALPHTPVSRLGVPLATSDHCAPFQ
jgi:hypothetical protein